MLVVCALILVFLLTTNVLILLLGNDDTQSAFQSGEIQALLGSQNTDTKKEVDANSDPAAFIQEAIKANQVTIFSKSFCPFCVKTKETLSTLENVTIKTFELVCNSSSTIELQLKSQQ